MPSKTAKPVPSDDVPLKKMDITQFWLAEDKDAESRSADEDMFETRNIVSQIRELVNREKVPLEKSKREQLMVSLANLRRYNRSMQLKLKAVREQTAQVQIQQIAYLLTLKLCGFIYLTKDMNGNSTKYEPK